MCPNTSFVPLRHSDIHPTPTLLFSVVASSWCHPAVQNSFMCSVATARTRLARCTARRDTAIKPRSESFTAVTLFPYFPSPTSLSLTHLLPHSSSPMTLEGALVYNHTSGPVSPVPSLGATYSCLARARPVGSALHAEWWRPQGLVRATRPAAVGAAASGSHV